MSFVIEIFAREYGKEKRVDYRRVVQALASYNWGNGKCDVRLKLSGLENQIDDILPAYKNFLKDFLKELDYNLGFIAHKFHFNLVGNSEEVLRRIKYEIDKKMKILPYLIRQSREFAKKVEKETCLDQIVVLTGSASPKINKLFIYYDTNEKIFVSDVDLRFYLPYVDEDIIKFVNHLAYEFSLKTKIPINSWVENLYKIPDEVLKFGIPIYISYGKS